VALPVLLALVLLLLQVLLVVVVALMLVLVMALVKVLIGLVALLQLLPCLCFLGLGVRTVNHPREVNGAVAQTQLRGPPRWAVGNTPTKHMYAFVLTNLKEHYTCKHLHAAVLEWAMFKER